MVLEAKKQEITTQKCKVSRFYIYFLKKMEFRTYFKHFHTFSYKFKVQRTPTEFGPPVSLITVSSRGQETREIQP